MSGAALVCALVDCARRLRRLQEAAKAPPPTRPATKRWFGRRCCPTRRSSSAGGARCSERLTRSIWLPRRPTGPVRVARFDFATWRWRLLEPSRAGLGDRSSRCPVESECSRASSAAPKDRASKRVPASRSSGSTGSNGDGWRRIRLERKQEAFEFGVSASGVVGDTAWILRDNGKLYGIDADDHIRRGRQPSSIPCASADRTRSRCVTTRFRSCDSSRWLPRGARFRTARRPSTSAGPRDADRRDRSW